MGTRFRPCRERRAGRSAAPSARGATLCALALVAATALVAAAAPPAAAQKSLVFERFHSDIEVQTTGELLVTETLRPRFTGEWNGILRHLSLRHTTAAGERERLDVELLSATDGRGNPLRHESNRIDATTREFKVWVPDARDRTAEVVIRYRVRGAIRWFLGSDSDDRDPAGSAGGDGPTADYDELYWQVTGTEWEVPIERATARVLLPDGAPVLQAAAYSGPPAAGGDAFDPADAEGRDQAIEFPAAGPLPPGEGYTIALAWPAGYVSMPAGEERAAPVRFGPGGSVPVADRGPIGAPSPVSWLPLALPFLAFWVAYRAWDRRGRDPAERAITVRWDPPEKLSPAEAGTLVDHDPGMHDIISTLVDLAVRGYLVIAEREKKGLLKTGTDYAFHLVRPRNDWTDLADHERRFLDGLFDGDVPREALANLAEEGSFLDNVLESVAGEPATDTAPPDAIDSVLLSDLQNRFYKEIPGIKDSLLDALVDKGHYLRRPDRARARWIAAAIVGFVLAFGGIPIMTIGTGTGLALGGSLIAGAGISAVILAVFAWIMPARTEQGARTREAALGFKRFLERVESPRYRRMIRSPEQFEEYLPWAVAFRCAERWAAAFDDLLVEPPTWYYGTHGTFRPSAFASDLDTLASTASSTMASSPSSSGSGGGGSVGGGSGGGGGGGF